MKYILCILVSLISVTESINLTYYTGTWFQVATSYSTKFRGTGPEYYCNKAIYKCIDQNCLKNNISVHNEGYNGGFREIEGFSYVLNESKPLERKIKFQGIPIVGNYNILKLGPIVNHKYDYSIVGSPYPLPFIKGNFALYVLTRDIYRYETEYKEEVIKWCMNNGFNNILNRYIETIRYDCPNYL